MITFSNISLRGYGLEEHTLVDVCIRRARESGELLAYTFLADGEIQGDTLTFAQLHERAQIIASRLLEVARPGDCALLVYEPGLDFVAAFYACLYSGVIAVPLPAPEATRVQRGLPRLKAVAADCNARLLLANTRTHSLLQSYRDALRLDGKSWIDTQMLAGDTMSAEVFAPSSPGALAYLQYTSGSTADPKGVMITHANLFANLEAIQSGLNYDDSSVSVSWMPHFHDYGLIEGLLLPLFNGTPAYLMSAFQFVKRPIRWLRAISNYRATHTQAPNFAYGHCVRRVSDEEVTTLDLSSWLSAGNGAEPVHPETLDAFYEKFASCGLKRKTLCPAYGLAEATLMISASPITEPPLIGWFDGAEMARSSAVPVSADDPKGHRVVACGHPLPGCEVAIVDPDTHQRLDTGRVGEIWVSSDSVAGGYWGRAEETRTTFHGRIEGEDDRSYLRTGDLGFLYDGQICITSRLKDLIIIRGLNHHPQDIEWTAQNAHSRVRPDNAAAFGIEVEGEDRLVVVQELERGNYTEADLHEILSSIFRAISDEHEVAPHEVVLIKRGSLLKSSSGKVQRRACREAYLTNSLQVVKRFTASDFDRLEPPASQICAVDMKCSGGDIETAEMRARRLIEWLREYGEQRINSRLIDERRCVPPHIIMDFGNRGLLGLLVPKNFGGSDLGYAHTMKVLEQLGAIDLSLATLVYLHNTNGILPILYHAAPKLKEEILPLLASGRELAAFALSEPQAGTHLGGIQMRAEAEGTSWVLDGMKRWNGSGWAGVISVFARLAGTDGKLDGLTGFVVRQSDHGLRVGSETLTMGMRGIMQNALHFHRVRVGEGRLLGKPGRGMEVVEPVLTVGRVATAAIAIGAMKRCAQLLLRYASRRWIETGKLLQNPQALVRIAEVTHWIAIAEELQTFCASRLDVRKTLAPEIAMALKVASTHWLNAAADSLIQLCGGRGYMESNIAPQILRDARALSIGEGSNEGLLAAIGRGVRLSNVVENFLDDYGPDATSRDSFQELSARIESSALRVSWDPATMRLWQDALLGRLACAAIDLACAQKIKGHRAQSATHEWAQRSLQQLEREIESGSPGTASALTPDDIRERIDSYRETIGDVEPTAPDVDLELDPLLRREYAQTESIDQTRTRHADLRDLPRKSLETKKTILRTLLKKQPLNP